MTVSRSSTSVMNVHFSSKTDLWATPLDLFTKLDAEFGFTVDVCATRDNAKCPSYFTPRVDGLEQEWRGVCWMNPPYGRQIKNWVKKAYLESLQGTTIVCLLPARTDTYVKRAQEIRFIRGRLKFGGSHNSAPFPSAIAVFRPPACGGREDRIQRGGSMLYCDYADQRKDER